jgi:hypothetical protein
MNDNGLVGMLPLLGVIVWFAIGMFSVEIWKKKILPKYNWKERQAELVVIYLYLCLGGLISFLIIKYKLWKEKK